MSRRSLILNADAKEINQLHGEIMAAVKTTLEKAIRIGELLTERKKKCQHGEWLPWLEANVQMDQKTVWNYMQFFEHRSKLGNVPNLTEALQLINEVRVANKKAKAPKDKPEPQPFGKNVTILQGNCLDVLPTLNAESVQCCITSPPFWQQRCYSDDPNQLGLERTVSGYVENLVKVFRRIRRVLKPDGIVWLNLGSTYNGRKTGDGRKRITDPYDPLRNGVPHSGLFKLQILPPTPSAQTDGGSTISVKFAQRYVTFLRFMKQAFEALWQPSQKRFFTLEEFVAFLPQL